MICHDLTRTHQAVCIIWLNVFVPTQHSNGHIIEWHLYTLWHQCYVVWLFNVFVHTLKWVLCCVAAHVTDQAVALCDKYDTHMASLPCVSLYVTWPLSPHCLCSYHFVISQIFILEWTQYINIKWHISYTYINRSSKVLFKTNNESKTTTYKTYMFCLLHVINKLITLI